MPDSITLACARADCPVVIPGSDFSRTCEKCGSRVMVAPAGQALLKKLGNVRIVCMYCLALKPSDHVAPVPGAVEEMHQVVPNTWGRRN